MKKSTIVMILICLAGLSLLLYPKVSDYWNSKHSAEVINNYVETLENMDEEDFDEIWEAAIAYNEALYISSRGETPYDIQSEQYEAALNLTGNGAMGYIDIPKIDVSLPILHGTEEEVLQRAIGHIEWTSLPTGGPNTHCALSGHRGLPSAKLLTDLDLLREGDQFTLTILDEVLTYEVDQIRTVEPTNVADLYIEDNKDYCTLVTCTPYGVNSHRLLVRGHRVETTVENRVHVISEAVIIDPLIVAPILAFPLIFTLSMMILLKKPAKKRTKEQIIREIQEKNHS